MKRKHEPMNFAPWDALGMAAHLEEMESRGWQFCGTDWLGRWVYEENLPQTVRYAVTYAPSRSGWRVTPTESERDLEFLCFDAGWRKIAALSKFHIYRNPDPNCTPLESDEVARLDTLERSLSAAIRSEVLMFLLWGGLMLALLIGGLFHNPPRFLATPLLPAAVGFCFYLILSQLIRWKMYLRWTNTARTAAEAGLPTPPVRGWRYYSRGSLICGTLILLCLVSLENLLLVLVYGAIILTFHALRWYLGNRMEDEYRAEKLFQAALAVAFLLLFCVNRFYSSATAPSLTAESFPLSARDLVDTTGMELYQYDLEGREAPWASYHDYWQPDNNSTFDLRYEVFDLRLPFLEDACRDWFRRDFDAITARWEQSIEPTDPAPWSAEAVWRSTGPDLYGWLVFYDGRIVLLNVTWDLTPDQITAAAEKLAP